MDDINRRLVANDTFADVSFSYFARMCFISPVIPVSDVIRICTEASGEDDRRVVSVVSTP
jgi:hypothetical protein